MDPYSEDDAGIRITTSTVMVARQVGRAYDTHMNPVVFSRFRRLATLALILAIGTAGALAISPDVFTDADAFAEILRSYGVSSLILFLLVGLIRPMTLIPAAIYGVSAGVLFGALLGATAAIIGQMGGVMVAFYLSRRLGSEGIRSLIGNRLTWIKSKDGFNAVLIGRLIPIFPGDVVSLAAGASGMKVGPYAAASVLGMAIPTILVALLGDAASRRDHPTIWITTTAIVLIIVGSILWRRLKTGTTENP
ncbi:VTT domain-containing protein [Dehalococcoidia bacterium]|nr:VTT domain-containing protein [Dehalococcoidia bacterium]